MATYQYLDSTNADGTILGQSTSSLISFYGVTPVARRSGAAQTAVSTSTIAAVSATVAPSSGGAQAWGFVSSTQANNVIDTVNDLKTRVSALITLDNEIRAALVALGAIAGA